MILTEKHIKCIELLCQPDMEMTKVAEEIGVSRSTIYNWMKDEKFSAELEKVEQDIKTRVHHDFVCRLPAAINKLWKITDSKDTRSALQAINAWIERAIGKVGTSVTVEDKRDNDDGFDLHAALKTIEENTAKRDKSINVQNIELKKPE